MELDKDFVEYYYNQYLKYGKNCILGWWSKTWEADDNTYNSAKQHLPYGTEVDYIGSGGMVIDRSIIKNYKELQSIPTKYQQVEDLYLCYLARQRGVKLISIEPHCRIIYDGYDQCKNLDEYKQEAFKDLIKKGKQNE